MKLTKCFTC